MKHTKGPWEIGYKDNADQAVIWGKGAQEVCTCWHHCVKSLEIEMEANARLIAAAPELYEWLKIATEWMEWWLGEDYCDCEEGHHTCGKHEREKELKLMQDAIAKAEGGENNGIQNNLYTGPEGKSDSTVGIRKNLQWGV